MQLNVSSSPAVSSNANQVFHDYYFECTTYFFFAKEKPRSFGLISIDFSSEMQFDTCVGRSIGKHGQWWLKKCCNGYAHLKSLQIEGVTSAGY